MEGLPLEIDQTGEVIDRHPLARIVFTDNTRGHSTELAAGYFGRQIQDRSVIDRMWHLRCEGLHEADEARVLLASLEADLVVRAGEAAAEEICALAARAAAGSRCKAAQSPLGFENRSFALSIRAARRFAELTLRYAAGDLPVSADPIAAAADTARPPGARCARHVSQNDLRRANHGTAADARGVFGPRAAKPSVLETEGLH